MEIKNRIAVVTGAASGIGRATCEALAYEGIRSIGAVDIGTEIHAFADQFNAQIGRKVIIPFQGDVVDTALREHVFEEIQNLHGTVSICIPAAGITRDRLSVKVENRNGSSFAKIYSPDDFQRVIDVDLVAPIYWALQTVASVAVDRSRRGLTQWDPVEGVQGCVVLVGSVSSAGNRGQISYATAKAGLEGAQATLATEAIYYGVRCAIIHPGFTDTPLVRAMGEDLISKHVLPNTQLRRLIRPKEIADAICFMIKNSAVSGALWADAGWHPNP